MNTIFPTACATGVGGTGARKKWNEANAKYPTPVTTGLGNGSGGFKKIAKLDIPNEEKKRLQSGSGSGMNPDWVEWLMGFPIGWTKLKGDYSGRRRKKDSRE
jgi:hypothetical protein